MILTDERLRVILAHLYGGNGDVRWVAKDPALYAAGTASTWLPISDAEFAEMGDRKLAIQNTRTGRLETSAQGRDYWRWIGSPKPEDL